VIRRILIINFLIITVLAGLPASETKDGLIRLLLNEKNGSFSFFYLAGSAAAGYEPLISHHLSPTSYLTVNVNGRSYQLGKPGSFKIKTDNTRETNAIVYESRFLSVRQVITPVKTSSSHEANGIKIEISIENKSQRDTPVGLRMLIDTYLGEGRRRIPFITGSQDITAETIIKSDSGESYWISKRDNLSLMGNIINPFNEDSKTPDYIHFANWKKLNDVPWNAPYHLGNSFNSIPYSIGDSAVCYFYEPDTLAPGASFNYIIYLTAEDTKWYTSSQITASVMDNIEWPELDSETNEDAAADDTAAANGESDILTLLKLHEVISQFLAGEILLNEQDLLEIEASINRLSGNR